MSRGAVPAGQPSPTLKATSSTSSLGDAAPRSAETSVYRESSMTTARGPGNSGRPQRDRDGNTPLTEPGRQVELLKPLISHVTPPTVTTASSPDGCGGISQ